jgi:hypothetical protein
VYYVLTEATKKRIIAELRNFWSYDPVYRDDLVGHIQGKYSFRQRPCAAIIVKNGSVSPFALSPDNFQGTVASYCHLAKVGNFPGLSVEWVREDGRAIQDNGGIFPSARGIYYMEVREETVRLDGVDAERKVFYVDPLLEVIDEEPMRLDSFRYQLMNTPLHEGSLRAFELPGNIPLVEDINYRIDYTTGIITLQEVLPTGVSLSVDYRYPAPSSGPFVIRDNHTNVTAIPGVVLAFGRRSEAGDIFAVIVGDRREPVAMEYGGRWDHSLDLDVMALDVNAQAEITDRTLMFLNGIARNRLSTEGMEITEVSMGGEAEEVYDETADDYFYTASISISMQTDWAIWVPLDAGFTRLIPQTREEADAAAAMTDDDLITRGEPNRLQMVQQLGLQVVQDPFFVGRTKTYEVIK